MRVLIPFPDFPASDILDQYPSRVARYREQKHAWDARCGGPSAKDGYRDFTGELAAWKPPAKAEPTTVAPSAFPDEPAERPAAVQMAATQPADALGFKPDDDAPTLSDKLAAAAQPPLTPFDWQRPKLDSSSIEPAIESPAVVPLSDGKAVMDGPSGTKATSQSDSISPPTSGSSTVASESSPTQGDIRTGKSERSGNSNRQAPVDTQPNRTSALLGMQTVPVPESRRQWNQKKPRSLLHKEASPRV